jgi:hypothetical protein
MLKPKGSTLHQHLEPVGIGLTGRQQQLRGVGDAVMRTGVAECQEGRGVGNQSFVNKLLVGGGVGQDCPSLSLCN